MVDTASELRNQSIQTLITIGEEKSIFERAIIEAFKQKQSKSIYEKLSIALDEIKFMVNEINTNENSMMRYLLNRNTLDKLSRIIERKYFNVNILIAKIYENLLDPANFSILSDDINLLIKFSNDVLNLLENIESTIVSKSLEKKCSSFLNYLINLQGLDADQIYTISELINNFPTRNCSTVYKNFDQIAEKIIKLSKSTSIDDKSDGINSLMENFGNTASLEEQFDLLMEKIPPIIKAIIHQPNPEFKDVYFQLGNFICSMLYATKFKVDAFMPEYRINYDDLNKNAFFFLLGDELIDETLKENVSFLHNVVYELSSQKEILTKCENIYSICNLILNTISIYETVFDLQFVCYIILKRIYFTYPQFRKNIEDTLAMNLINLCGFNDQFERDNSEECRQFVYYLLKNGEEELKRKLQKRIETKKIEFDQDAYTEEDIADVENEILKLADFNLRIGYPNKQEIDAGCEMSKYIEVHHPNSLVYIGFATQYNDINLHLLKYIPNDENKQISRKDNHIIEDNTDISDDDNTSQSEEDYTDKGHFREILKLDRIDASLSPVKVVMFIKEPGTYKLVFDNSFSWFNSKLLRFRLSVLKPISEIDFNRKVDFDALRKKMNMDIKRQYNQSGYQQEIELSNISREQVDLKHIKNSPHANKILMAKIEGANRAYKIDHIFLKQELMKDNPKYLSIPVILTSKSIRILRTYSNEYGMNTDEYMEYPIENDTNYEKTFTDKISTYINDITDYNNKSLFLNVFLVDKHLAISQENTDANIPISNSNDKFYKNVLNKLTFWPQDLMTKFPNLKLFLNSLSDSCLLYTLYEKLIDDKKFNNIIHIHFDKIKPQVSLFFEGIFHDKISGFNYDNNKSLIENVENVIEFVNKVSVIFGEFELSISSSDIDEK